MEKKKILVGGVVYIAAAVATVLCLGFIVLDASVLKWTIGNLEGTEGLGVAIVLALSLSIQYPAAAVNLIFQLICGVVMVTYPKRELVLHKALRVIATIVGVVAALVHGFFALTYLNGGVALWGVLSLLVAVLALVAPIISAVAHKEV